MDAPLLQNVVLKFLNELKKTVHESTKVVEGKRQPKENFLIETLSYPSAHEDDSSSSSSCSEGLEIINGNFAQTELGQNSDEIDDIISSLVKVSFRIRGIRSRDSQTARKAMIYKEFIQDEEMNTFDVFSIYSVFDQRHVEEWIVQLRKAAEARVSTSHDPAQNTTDRVGNGEDQSHERISIFRDSDKRLIDRWSKAATVRRRTLAYWRRHARKLAKLDPEAVQQESQVIVPMPESFDTIQPAVLPPRILRVTAPDSVVVPSSEGVTLLSETEATQIPTQMDVTDTLSTASHSTYWSEEGKTTNLPKPPKLESWKSEFTCPYCHVLCPKRDTRGRHWRDHIMQDLQPYQCTYSDCESADVLFTSKDSWTGHESQVHRKVWRCFEHPDLFTSEDELALHFELSHATLGSTQVQEILKHAYTSTQDLRTECPFCLSHGPFEEDFTSHMASHMERLALFSIPTGMGNDDQGYGSDGQSKTSGSGAAQGGGSVSSLNSVSLAFSDAGSLLPSASEPGTTGRQTTDSPAFEPQDDDAPKLDASSERELWDWLAPERQTRVYESYLGKRHPGTLRLFFKSTEYRSSISSMDLWRTSDPFKGRRLYLPGLPGAGKSVLAAAIIEDLAKRFKSPGLRIAYYFCPSRRQKRTTEALLQSLIRQILEGLPEIPDIVRTLYGSYLQDGTLPPQSALLDILKEAAGKVSRLFIIIDGFEILSSDQGRKLSESLGSLAQSFNTHVLVTSRSIPYIEHNFGLWWTMNVRGSKEDLRSYARAAILHDNTSTSLEVEKLQQAETRVVQFSKRVFSFATIYLESTILTPTEWTGHANPGRELQKMIDIFYTAEMKRNQDFSGFETVTELLAWVVRSPTRLQLRELKEVLLLQAESGSTRGAVDPDHLHDMEKLLFWCSGLVVHSDDGSLQLFHPTANEYFIRNQTKWFPKAAENQAYFCCVYLRNATDKDEDLDHGLQYYITKYPFVVHAAVAWGRHAFQAFEKNGLGQVRLYILVQDFLSSKEDVVLGGSPSLFELAAECGHKPILDLLLDRWNRERSIIDGILLGAARGGCKDIAKMALDLGADPRKPAPLCAASQYGQDRIIRLLLNTAADLVEYGHEEPLRLAIRNGNLSIIRLFFDRGVPHYANWNPEKLLSEAIKAKRKSITRFLLKTEPRLVTAELEEGTKPLFLAIEQDDIGMVELLLQCGARVHEKAKDGLTPKEKANDLGRTRMVDAIASWEERSGGIEDAVAGS
ncbi:uncharacterized protein BDZ83DRAFT_776467 [Colletotrichum acutatum]|uniref:NACHT domain-containing protein n=1 Tax=Glomerella acutata TaxID=27357 RepID=A0AAD8XP53_GLOAC|nr:uncharacterized protein BDZ83DRAFT_776467 [Colletotrichum acutatum]KAK1730954.1 hypothetical protein BDZ83DRAFT_776467 [Colletotrichum acutatum]